MRNTLENDKEEIDEGMKDFIGIGLLIALLSVPKILPAEDLKREVASFPNITAAEVRAAVERVSSKNSPKSKYGRWTGIQTINIVARTLYAESRKEGKRGIDAVASAILNRAGGKPENLADVCLKRKQFSCWNALKAREPATFEIRIPGKARKPGKNRELWLYCQTVAGKMLFGEFTSTIGNRNSYYAHNKVTPAWAATMKDAMKVGNHTFGYLPEQDGKRK